MKLNKKFLYIAASLFVAFSVFTILVATVDVAAATVVNSKVADTKIGFSHMNIAFFNKTHPDGKYNTLWYKFTGILGYAAIVEAVGFIVYGIYQAISRKSIKKLDCDLYVLFIAYLVLAISYLAFEIWPVNYRPVLLDGTSPEASYPSSHTLLVGTIVGAGIPVLSRRIESKFTRISIDILSGVVIGVTTIGRALSGVHYLTDIIGGVLLAAALVFFTISVSFPTPVAPAEVNVNDTNQTAEGDTTQSA